MSQNEMKETAQEIAEGLKRLGSNRVVALSVHVSKDLIEELEIKANKLVVLLESAS
jgi:aminoglycoside N3'-acetyltransferase|tara:strand:+ start:139 stop:306 length:168 start_codon:yes stop_codon:yes gene_type:complete